MGLGSWKKKALAQLDKHTELDAAACASLLSECGSSKFLPVGRQLHNHIIRMGRDKDSSLEFYILQMYGRCGALADACAWFAAMCDPTVSSWNYMMGAYWRNGQNVHVLQMFAQMQEEGVLPDKAAMINVLSSCCSLTALDEGKRTDARAVHMEFGSDVEIATALINMYGKCGDLEHAQSLFNGMAVRDVVAWNAMITLHSQLENGKDAMQLFCQLLCEGFSPTRATYASVLSACTNQRDLNQGKQVQCYCIQTGFDSEPVIASALVHLYSKCGNLREAEMTFHALSKCDAVTGNAMITAYAQHRHLKEAIENLAKLQLEGIAVDKSSFMCLLDACGSEAALPAAKQLHAFINKSGYGADNKIVNALISVYGRCGSLGNAQKLFDKMNNKDIVSWNALIAAYGQNGFGKEAMKVFDQMQQAGVIPDRVTIISLLDASANSNAQIDTESLNKHVLHCGFLSDIVVSTALVRMYGSSGNLVEAQYVFNRMPQRNVVTWTAMITVYCLHGLDEEAIQLFTQMLHEGVFPDGITFLNVISACTLHAVLDVGRTLHCRLRYTLFKLDTVIGNALINMYGKCGSLDDAWNIFAKMQSPNVSTWNALIAVYAQHGQGREALCMFDQMQKAGLTPDNATFASFLSACNHTGLVSEAFHCLSSMIDDYGAPPALEHFDCAVDLLGRAGLLNEAVKLISTMPFQPAAFSWTTMLGAFRNQADSMGAKWTAKQIFELDKEDPTPYVMLSNVYVDVGMLDDYPVTSTILKHICSFC